MVKFNQAFKLKVVTDYLNGKGPTTLYRKYNIAELSTIKHCQNYGMTGLVVQKPNTNTYTLAFKLKVLSFQKRHQLFYSKTALYFNIPTASTVYNW